MTDLPTTPTVPSAPASVAEPGTQTSGPEGDTAQQLQAALSRLTRLAWWARVMLIVQRGGWLIAGTVAVVMLLSVIDWFLRSPMTFRTVILVLGVIALSTALWRRLWPALRFRPSLSQIALRIERTDEGRSAGLAGLLASAVELSRDPGDLALQRALAAGVVRDAGARLAKVNVSSVLKPQPAGRALFAVVLAGTATVTLIGLEPALSSIALQRTLTPWSGSQWPKLTQLADATAIKAHALGAALPLRAALVRTPRAAQETSVTVHYRLITPGGPGPTQTAELTSQSRTVAVTTRSELGNEMLTQAALMERLLEPAALVPKPLPATPLEPDSTAIEYWFTSGDDETTPARVRLITPPVVVTAVASIQPPEYIKAGPLSKRRELDMGPGTDQRATAPDILAASRVSLTLSFNKDLPVPGTLAGALGTELATAVESLSSAARFDAQPRAWTIELPLTTSLRIPVTLTDGLGISSTEEAVYRLAVKADKPPEATIVKPTRDEDVLPEAVVETLAEARDDTGLASLALQAQLARRPMGSAGAAPEPKDPPETISQAKLPVGDDAAPLTLATAMPLDLTTLAVVPGDEVWLSALATDIYAVGETRHDAVRSPIRRLRVISRQQLVEQLFGQLAGVKRQATKAAADQEKAAKESARAQPGDLSPQAQASISEQVKQIQQQLKDVAQRAAEASKSKPLEDAELNEVLKAAEEAAKAADQASQGAQRSLEQAKQAARDQQASKASSEQAAAERQQQAAKQKLEELAQALDRGEGAFAQRRRVQQLLSEQQQIRQKTGELSRETAGKTAEQFTPQQRQQAERLAQEQESLARRSEELLKSLREKSEELTQQDPAGAEALKQAAKTGEQQGVSEQMQQAAKQIQRNQQQQAQQQQQRAEQSLQQMLQQLNDAQKQRDAVLKRQLDSLVQTLQTLIARQERELTALEAAKPETFGALSEGMIRLHTATLASVEQARALGDKGAAVEELITTAAGRQAAAIASLRASPADTPTARTAETDALNKLREALTEAQKQQEQAQQRDDARARAELRKAYQEAKATQDELLRQANAAVNSPADRRQRSLARQIAEDQDKLLTTLEDLRKNNEDVTKSATFTLAHSFMQEAGTKASALLREPPLTALIPLRQGTVSETLAALIDALDDQAAQEEFRENEQGDEQQQGGGEQGQQGSSLPPITQLKALRELQARALKATRAAEQFVETPAIAKDLITEAAGIQRRLATEAKNLIEQMKQGGQ